MAKLSKRAKMIEEKVDRMRAYPVEEAIKVLQECAASTKFNESVDTVVRLGIDPRKADQAVRGAVVLPHGTGRDVRVAVFAQDDNAKAAQDAGADIVGFDELAADIKKGKIDFDVLIATPQAMKVVGQLGPVLGPRGLMPNPKVGTVTQDVAGAVKNAKSGQVQFRAEKAGIIHGTIGRADFKVDAIKENLKALIEALKKAKPSNSKGVYLKKVVLSTTMGPGITIDMTTV